MNSLRSFFQHVDSGRCWFFVVQIWRIPRQNGNLLLRFEELNSEISLCLATELIELSVLSICSDSTLFGLFICESLSLFLDCSVSWFHCARWAAFGLPRISSISRSASLCLLHISPFCPEHTPRRRSLLMLVLSHSHTHYLNRHMVGCGCHEILIQRCITVLIMLNFSRYPIHLWCWCLSHSNHSFQLIDIQYGFHHSVPPRNHQSCYQELFISTSNWRQAHIQRHISCCHSSKASEFIPSKMHWIHWLAKSNALAVSERSHNYPPSNRKYMRQ